MHYVLDSDPATRAFARSLIAFAKYGDGAVRCLFNPGVADERGESDIEPLLREVAPLADAL